MSTRVGPVEPGRLGLHELRAYRSALRAEEDRVSYWRRVLHGRVDLLRAGRAARGTLTLGQLERALGATGTGRRRDRLLRVQAFDPLPDLPVLAEVWCEDASLETLRRLDEAAVQLSRYRRALHARTDAASAELVARYRHDPTLALEVLG